MSLIQMDHLTHSCKTRKRHPTWRKHYVSLNMDGGQVRSVFLRNYRSAIRLTPLADISISDGPEAPSPICIDHLPSLISSSSRPASPKVPVVLPRAVARP
jgi:hypothetical protein